MLNWAKDKLAVANVFEALSPQVLGTGEFLVYVETDALVNVINSHSGKHTSRTQIEVSSYTLASRKFGSCVYISDAGQFYRFDLRHRKAHPHFKVKLEDVENHMQRLSVRMLEDDILQISEATPIERVFEIHRQRHNQDVVDPPEKEPQLEANFSWGKIGYFKWNWNFLDSEAETLFVASLVNDDLNEHCYESYHYPEISIDLSFKTTGHEFKSTLKIERNLIRDDDAIYGRNEEDEVRNQNYQKNVLISFCQRTQSAHYQIFEPVLRIGRILKVDDSSIHFIPQITKLNLETIQREIETVKIDDSLQKASLCYGRHLASMCSIENSLEPLGSAAKFAMKNSLHHTGECIEQQ